MKKDPNLKCGFCEVKAIRVCMNVTEMDDCSFCPPELSKIWMKAKNRPPIQVLVIGADAERCVGLVDFIKRTLHNESQHIRIHQGDGYLSHGFIGIMPYNVSLDVVTPIKEHNVEGRKGN